jgi:zinc and cadmium transporter
MNEYYWVGAYSLLILLGSVLGGFVPLVGKVTHSRLQFYLSFSAGVMLGASFFHVMPHAMIYSSSEGWFGIWMSAGVVVLLFIERFIAPHSHEMNGHGTHPHHHHEHNHGEHHHHDHHHHPHEPHAVAPAIAGWMAVLGLTLHTFMNGVGLAGLVDADMIAHPEMEDLSAALSSFALPGLAIFLAIALHKPADALAISTVLMRKGVSRPKILLVQILFALMVPVGALAYYITQGMIEQTLHGQVIGAALAFSAGTFLFIALSDLLPEVQFHRHDRVQLFVIFFIGVAFMGFIGVLEGHFSEHGHSHGHSHAGHKH